MTRLFQPQLPGRGTIWSPSYSRVKANSEVLHRGICLDLDHYVISLHDSPFWSRDLRDIPIESSEINLHSILDFRSMPIKSSIQNSRLVPWFWLIPNRSYVHPSYQMNFYWKLRMDCLASMQGFHPKEGLSWKILIPLMIRTQNRSNGPYSYTFSFIMGLWTFLSFSIRRSNHSLHEHEVLFWFITKSHAHPWFLQNLLLCQGTTSCTIILGFPIIDAL